jgi:hypothetical protein
MYFADDDPHASIDGAIACISSVVRPTADAVTVPPVVGPEKNGIYVTDGDIQFIYGSREVLCGPAVVPLVAVMKIWEAVCDIGEIAAGDTAAGLVGVVVEIGDTVADSYPGEGAVDEGCRRGNQEGKNNEPFHNRKITTKIGYAGEGCGFLLFLCLAKMSEI